MLEVLTTRYRAGGVLAQDNLPNRFASIEALARFLRQTALLFTEQGEAPFSAAERLALAEVTYEVGQDGRVGDKPTKIRTLDGICLSLDVIARSAGGAYRVDKSGGKWRSHCSAVKVRDRLTHPKSAQDFVVTDQEMKHLHSGWRWYMDELRKAVRRPE